MMTAGVLMSTRLLFILLNSVQISLPQKTNQLHDLNFETFDSRKFDSAKSNLHNERRLPEAIIIGVKKGGTRALLEYLRINPLVKAPGPEVHFFDRYYDRGLEWYRKQMPPVAPNELLLEKTPSYFITKPAPERVYSMNPKMKLLVVVRDPVTRAISGLYHRHVKRWRKYFPLHQIHFVSGEKLISNPASEMQSVEEFLGLPNFIRKRHFVFSQEKGFPCIIRTGQNRNTANIQPHCLGKTKGRTHPDIDPMVIDRLRAFYLPQNDRFYRLVGRNFRW